ncbi:MAG: hypothetical protein OEX07_13065, partial [Gammaproteobacteria bacterium]|nr:hypothetical protein [Gammaproteobacteria bacterium]
SDNSVALIDPSSGEITAQNVSGEAQTTITASYQGVVGSKVIYVSSPGVYDSVVYQESTMPVTMSSTKAEQSRIENLAAPNTPIVKAFYNPTGLLAGIPMAEPFTGYFVTMTNELTKDKMAIAFSTAVVGTFDSSIDTANATISYVPDQSVNEFYTLDGLAAGSSNTSVQVNVTSIDAGLNGRAIGDFTAVLCKKSAIDNNTCDLETNQITLTGEFNSSFENDVAFNCYASSNPKVIDEYTMHSYQEICAGSQSYYQLNTVEGFDYEIKTTSVNSTNAEVSITAYTEGNNSTPVNETITGNERSVIITAGAQPSYISFSYSGSVGTTFKLDITPQSVLPEGSLNTPVTFARNAIPTTSVLSVDETSSYYKIPVTNGHLYKLFIQEFIAGSPALFSGVNSDYSAMQDCTTIPCSIRATGDFVYIKLDGPAGGFAKTKITLAYQSDRDPNNYGEALTLNGTITNFQGQVGGPDIAADGTINTLQGSLYWVSGLKANTAYVVKIRGVDKLTQLWINGNTSLSKNCNTAGNDETTEFSCYIETGNFFYGFSVGVTTVHSFGTKYTMDIEEVTDDIYFVSTFANAKTGEATDSTGASAITEIALYRQNDSLPFIRSVTDSDRFNSNAFSIKSGETIYIQVTDPSRRGDFYSIIVNRNGNVTTANAYPAKPDIYEAIGDNGTSGATVLTLDQASHHSLLNSDESLGDQDWFSFTAP